MAPFRPGSGPQFRAQERGLPSLPLSSSRSCPLRRPGLRRQALLAMWAPPLASCVTVGREQNLSVPPLLCLRRESVATFLRHPEE